MPYEVRSQCPACGQGDEFVIGLWPEHLGVYVCPDCASVVNVPFGSGACQCGRRPATEEFYDYAYAIPYLGGQSLGEIEPGPLCPKCANGRLMFETTSHFNVGRLGATEDGDRPWVGQDYLEKAIFVCAVMAVCSELDLDPEEILEYYSLDVPASLMAERRVSLPILLDIRNHLVAAALAGEAAFTVTGKLAKAIEELLRWHESKKKSWWQFWR